MTSLEVLFTPAEFAKLPERDLSDTWCVVFDVLRATSTMVTALGNGAAAILPVQGISEALAARRSEPTVLLAGERNGLRIGPELAEGISFDLGNSPREFVAPVVSGKRIVMTTTNGTRALFACRHAQTTLAGSFLNLAATAQSILQARPARLVIICSGTFEQTAYEDVLGAGALCDLLWDPHTRADIDDSAHLAHELFLEARGDLTRALNRSRNARRLLSQPDLRDDVAFCLHRDVHSLVACLEKDGWIRRQQRDAATKV
jgi:2-phosphosulfolactate phosphatase